MVDDVDIPIKLTMENGLKLKIKKLFYDLKETTVVAYFFLNDVKWILLYYEYVAIHKIATGQTASFFL